MLIAFDKSNTGSPFAQHLDQDQLSQKDLCRLRTLIKDGPDPDTHTWNHHLESPGSICLTSCYTLLHTWNHQGQYVFNPATHLESPAYHHVHVSVGSYPGCHSEWKWEIGLWENGKKLEIFFYTIHLFHIIISMTTTYWMIILNVCLYFEIIKKLHKFLFWLFITFLTLKDGYTMLRRTYFIQFSTFYSS